MKKLYRFLKQLEEEKRMDTEIFSTHKNIISS
jgi:hypothetical protein